MKGIGRVTCFVLLGLVDPAWSLSLNENAIQSRRTFARNAFTTAATTASLGFLGTRPVMAYERRDVGGEGRSAATAAMNIQAYETQNRLEREGFKLETQAEQQASLTAALSEYSYDPSIRSSSTGKTASKNKSKQSSTAKDTTK